MTDYSAPPDSELAFTLPRRLACEGLGTGVLVAAVIGSGIMADRLTGDVALALLANTIATGAILVVLITALGPISGAHLNPAVSLVFWRWGGLSAREAMLYAVVQIAGGAAGAVLAHAMFELPLLQASTTARTGAAQWLSEGVATFGLVLTILAGLRARPHAVPWLVGLYITAAYWFTASTSFANPAVAIARAMSDTFAGIRPQDVPAFVAVQLIAALAAGLFCAWLLTPTDPAETLRAKLRKPR